jgi:hypothetical protein
MQTVTPARLRTADCGHRADAVGVALGTLADPLFTERECEDAAAQSGKRQR